MLVRTLKEHIFEKEEILWMKEVFATKEFDPKVAKVKLRNSLSKGFNPKQIDDRFLVDGKTLTPLGIWYLDPENALFKNIENTILAIKKIIVENPGIEIIESKELQKILNLDISTVEITLYNLQFFGKFFSSAESSSSELKFRINRIGLTGDDAYDAYLYFESIENLLEETYNRLGKRLHAAQRPIAFTSTDSWNTVTFQQAYEEDDFEEEVKKDTAFVLMAMDPNIYELTDIYQTIKEVCSRFSIKAYRADEIEHQDRITDLILNEIASCEFLIADLSYERPNVYYEIGYAHALDKRPILYRKCGTKLHFDLSVHNVPEYKNITELKELLAKRFEAILGRTPKG